MQLSNNTRLILTALGFLLILLIGWYLRTIIAYILISGVLSILGAPFVEKLKKIKLGRFYLPDSIAAGITLFVIFSIVIGLFSILTPIIAQEAKILSNIKVEEVFQSLEQPLTGLEETMSSLHILSNSDKELSEYVQEKISGLVNVADVTNVFSGLVNVLGNILIAIFSIAFITFFFLKEKGLFYKMIISLSPTKHLEKTKDILKNTKRLLSRYFIGITIQISTISLLVGIGLSLLGIENAIVIAVFAGLINVIPYIGPLIGIAVGLLIGLTTNLHLDFYTELVPLLGYILMVFIIVQSLDNFVFQPLIFSNSVNAHPLEIFIIILISGNVLGVAGMILAIPTYTFIRIIAKEFLSHFSVVQSLTKDL